MFATLGARGDLSATHNGLVVDYESPEVAEDEDTYYYRPSGKISFCV